MNQISSFIFLCVIHARLNIPDKSIWLIKQVMWLRADARRMGEETSFHSGFFSGKWDPDYNNAGGGVGKTDSAQLGNGFTC